MRLRCLIVIITLFVALKAEAQIGIYGTLTGTRTAYRTQYSFTAGSNDSWAFGGGAGIYDDFLHIGPLRVGADLRGSILKYERTRLNSLLAGVRLAVKPPVLPIKPYVQASVGLGRTGSLTMTNALQYQFFGGLDLTFFPRLDWRVVEVGVGSLDMPPGTHTLTTVSTGIVFRLP